MVAAKLRTERLGSLDYVIATIVDRDTDPIDTRLHACQPLAAAALVVLRPPTCQSHIPTIKTPQS